MSFKRSPSKVWWASEALDLRNVSSSPGSQDSGFSDTETSPQNRQRGKKTDEKENLDSTPQKQNSIGQIPRNIFKQVDENENFKNLSSNYKEKITPEKQNIEQRLVKTDRKNSPHVNKKFSCGVPNTEPIKRNRYIKNSPKISRNLFNDLSTEQNEECSKRQPNLYSNSTSSSLCYPEETNEENSISSTSSSEISSTKSLPLDKNDNFDSLRVEELNQSAPAVLETNKFDSYKTDDKNQDTVNFNNNSISSDTESELECLFDSLGKPEHTSTPKAGIGELEEMRHRRRHRKVQLRTPLKFQFANEDRVPPIHTDGITVDNQAVQRWLQEARQAAEQECTTTLQCKSIAAELNQKVNQLASCRTTILRGILSYSRCIEMDYRNLNSEKVHIHPLAQSLAGNIVDFLKTHTNQINTEILRLHDEVRLSQHSEQLLTAMTDLFSHWENVYNQILVKEVKMLVDKLEDPISEMDLRATLTGITSVALRNGELVEYFVKTDIIPILLILCEKCEGSSMRSLILRALSTMCTNSVAIRHFEKFSGIQIIADTIEEESRPEPERSEAVALLAQVTAPWLEDSHSVRGLQDYSKKLVRSLTKFSLNTKCCQNLLLCAAALANISSLDSRSVRYLSQFDTAKTLLTAVKSRGPLASVYLLEQVATLLANMAAVDGVKRQLVECKACSALVNFLKSKPLIQNEEVECRLQQKSVIALSRLCSDPEAAKEVLICGGEKRLVELCREREERFNNDAVLVAALATLRKIVEMCGAEVLSIEDAQELVEPKLLDSFLAYSAQNESFV